jgi:hypothetical protein
VGVYDTKATNRRGRFLYNHAAAITGRYDLIKKELETLVVMSWPPFLERKLLYWRGGGEVGLRVGEEGRYRLLAGAEYTNMYVNNIRRLLSQVEIK